MIRKKPDNGQRGREGAETLANEKGECGKGRTGGSGCWKKRRV